jgi:hypothetical protein
MAEHGAKRDTLNIRVKPELRGLIDRAFPGRLAQTPGAREPGQRRQPNLRCLG